VWDARSTIYKPFAQSLIYSDCPLPTIQTNGPGSFPTRLGREIQAQRYAEFALFSINVFLEDGTAQVGGRVNIGWNDWLTHDEAYGFGHLLVKKTSDALVVNSITPGTLLVP
jgi:hypothetical protein